MTMYWLILPEIVTGHLHANTVARSMLASLMDTPPQTFISPNTSSPTRIIGTSHPINDDAHIVGLWFGENPAPIRLDINRYLSIWCNTNDRTITSLDVDERAEILERLCLLASHLWNQRPLPENWKAKKIGGIATIFAAGRPLEDLRISYAVRRFDEGRVIDVGNIFVARRQHPEAVPELPLNILENVPPQMEAPRDLDNAEEVTDVDYRDSESRLVDEDVLIERSGESYHLFSLTYQQWIDKSSPLTPGQRRVIGHKVEGPLRIHGPGGSGKTLVLILKTLSILSDAQDKDERCYVLFAVTSDAVNRTVRAAIEVIDNRGFLATTKSDPQYLDISTLHGWCMQELGIENGNAYVLERDPKESKQKQRRILNDVLEEVLAERYESKRRILSEDFVARIEGDRNALLRDLVWEIGIRIKGRGLRTADRDRYFDPKFKTFLGPRATLFDKHFLFYLFEQYERRFKEENLLDTDDVVLSMSARLSASLWDRQRIRMGFDYVMVDETHLFNENERRVLPLLTRGDREYPRLIMTFDEAQSIGGQRNVDLEEVGIKGTQRRNLKEVHRSSPDIFALARDLVERSPLAFTEFLTSKMKVSMTNKELERCRKPFLHTVGRNMSLGGATAEIAKKLRAKGYYRVALISFDVVGYEEMLTELRGNLDVVIEIAERGEKLGAAPRQGIYFMSPEACGGLEFDAVLLIGADLGRVPVPLGDISQEGYQSNVEEAYMELYTAVTRAKYVLGFISDGERGVSELVKPSIRTGLIVGHFD